MAVHNGEATLRTAMDSILAQTFTDFEFLVIDDASTDQTPAILDSYHDPRIIRLNNTVNLGLAKSLNRGLESVCGEYIARMDADDISLPERLQVQVAFLDTHPSIDLLGANIRYIDSHDSLIEKQPPYDRYLPPHLIRWLLHWGNTFIHSTVMLRRRAIVESGIRYQADLAAAQDYELWARFVRTSDAAILPDFLVYYRINPEGISYKRQQAQEEVRQSTMRRELEKLIPEGLNSAGFAALTVLFSPFPSKLDSASDLLAAAQIIQQAHKRFIAANPRITTFERKQLDDHAVTQLRNISYIASWFSAQNAIGALLLISKISPRAFWTAAMIRAMFGCIRRRAMALLR